MLATGLMAGSGRARALRHTSRLGLAGIVVALAVAGSGTTALVMAAQDGGPGGAIDRLIALEQKLPPWPPDAVLVDDATTWGEFTGDFVGAKVQFDAIEEEARDLFVSADKLKDADGQAVAEVARAILVLQEAYTHLANAESKDLIFPLDTFDDFDTSTGADPSVGWYEAGFELYYDAIERAKPAYELLAVASAADATEQAYFNGRYETMVAAEVELIPNLRLAMSDPSTQVQFTLDRFESTAPGQNARARSMRITCLDREAYELAVAAGADPALLDALLAESDVITVDCPEADNGNTVVLVDGN